MKLTKLIIISLLLLGNGCSSPQHKLAPPRVNMLIRYFKTPEKLQQFAKDRRAVRKLIKHNWKRDTIMHKLWLLEKTNPDIYRDILEKRGL